MSDILCVTDRCSCDEDFLLRIEKIAQARPLGIILRDKELDEGEYKALAACVMKICEKHGVRCILHSFTETAIELSADSIHLPMTVLRGLDDAAKRKFTHIGASCHSAEEALAAVSLGCTYITAGHIFETDCKKGLAGRGLDYLEKVCGAVSLPVYAIGGITPDVITDIRRCGASGACVMSGLMKCADPVSYLAEFERGQYEIQ